MTNNLPPLKCRNCTFENPGDAKFCQNCGQALTFVCGECGTQNEFDAKFCKNCGASLDIASPAKDEFRLAAMQQAAPQVLQEKIRASSSQIEGERKPVTILFADIVGSTAIADKLDPEEWKEIVSGAHRRVGEAIYRYEGTIAQLLGDGVLAFFGAPITHEDDPIRAVHAALDIQETIGVYARDLHGFVDNFRMRIGVNTGTVVVGSIGDDLHMEYLAVGDSVNLAARLQSAAEPGTVLISDTTARLIQADFELQDLGHVEMKGKAEPVKVHAVIKRKDIPESARGIEGLKSPLVGRADDMAALEEALRGLLDGRGQIVYVMGDAGIGKTRLVEEARQTSEDKVHWLEGRALSYGQTLSFWPITELIKSDLGLSEADPELKVKVALRRRVEQLFVEGSGAVLPYLAYLLGLGLKDEMADRVKALDGETLKRQTMVSISRYVTQLAKNEPTILVFEDLHWADASTLEALEEMLATTNYAPLMLLLVGRIDRDHGSWRVKLKAETDFAHRYTEIQLRALSTNESNQLVDNLLAIAELPEEVRRTMLDRSEGNPFYLEEVIRNLIDQGALVREEHRWRSTRALAELEIPDTLHGVLLARIDRLEEDVRRTLQTASVIGKSFLYSLLEAIAKAERELDQHLAQLQRVDLVREKRRLPELEYVFKHSLTQEAAYNSLLVERRKEFHLKVGEAVEQLFADRTEEFLGLLAHHFDLGGHREKAISYLLRAGDRARLEIALEEAIQYYQRAIELQSEAGEETQAAETWLKLGLVYHTDFRFEDAHHANETAFALRRKTKMTEPQKEMRPPSKPLGATLRSAFPLFDIMTLDPGRVMTNTEGILVDQLFAGIAEVDHELNLVPYAASSWEVLDDGKRYLIHLRDDVRWSDGEPLTAEDFEWSWRRNLSPSIASHSASMLDDITGAREYRIGLNNDPDSVAVRARDSLTLEVRLSTPVAYFPYLLAFPVTFPLRRDTVEHYGDDWWKPEHIVSNGAYRMTHFDMTRAIVFERNPNYFGDFPGNLERLEWILIRDANKREQLFREGQHSYLFMPVDEVPPDLAPLRQSSPATLFTTYVLLAPLPPLDDIRVRRALIHGLDRQELARMRGTAPARGGMVPPGMPGHSPELGLPYDLELAKRLLAEAGYPEGRDLPLIEGISFGSNSQCVEIVRQWRDGLGVEVGLETGERVDHDTRRQHIFVDGWIADYPDPDSFLRNATYLNWLRSKGWQDPTYEEKVERAAQTPDRAKRMSMYREADCHLVVDEAVLVPLEYGMKRHNQLCHSWLKDIQFSAIGMVRYKNAFIEPH